MKALILGMGEVGSALYSLIPTADCWDVQSGETMPTGRYDFLHICFGYSPVFLANVWDSISRWLEKDGVCIIHSTVPAGITRNCVRAVHSPVHGKHPHLATGLKTFRKFVGGVDADLVDRACTHLRAHGMHAIPVTNPETSELSKRWCLRQYAMAILLEKLCAADCERHGANRDEVYDWWNREYNAGWNKLGYTRFTRPVLDHVPGPIGGHCVLQNSEHTPKEFIDGMILLMAEAVEKLPPKGSGT